MNDESEVTYSGNFLNSSFADFLADRSGTNSDANTELSFYFDRPNFAEFPLSAFVASFTEDGDLLSQWERYSGSHGYCVGFDAEKLRSILEQSGRFLTKVVYYPVIQKNLLNEVFEVDYDRLEQGEFGSATAETLQRWAAIHATIARSISLTFKHPAFAEEKEWRSSELVAHEAANTLEIRPGRFGVIPYLRVPISDEGNDSVCDVVVAPTRYEEEAKSGVELTLRRFNYDVDKVNVWVSKVPLRV